MEEVKRCLQRRRRRVTFRRNAFRLANGRAIPGLLPTLRDRFYRTYTLGLAPNCAASMSIQEGLFSDFCVQHAAHCTVLRNARLCRCFEWSASQRRMAGTLDRVRAYFDDLAALHFVLLESQYAVTNGRVATAIDDVCYDTRNKCLVVVERKSGFARRLDIAAGQRTGGPWLSGRFSAFSNCVATHHFLQASGGAVLLRQTTGMAVKPYVCYMHLQHRHEGALPNLRLSWHPSPIECSSDWL